MTPLSKPDGEPSVFHGGTEADRRSIADLHARDEAASRDYDLAALRALLSDDVVILAPGQRPMIGSAALRSPSTGGAKPPPKILAYRFEWAEVQVIPPFAFEWGQLFGRHAQSDSDGNGEIADACYNVLRILKRDPDGVWKVHRTIWNDAPLPAIEPR